MKANEVLRSYKGFPVRFIETPNGCFYTCWKTGDCVLESGKKLPNEERARMILIKKLSVKPKGETIISRNKIKKSYRNLAEELMDSALIKKNSLFSLDPYKVKKVLSKYDIKL